jgi:hypothetical protein
MCAAAVHGLKTIDSTFLLLMLLLSCRAQAMLGDLCLLLWVGILSVAVGLYDITLVKVR